MLTIATINDMLGLRVGDQLEINENLEYLQANKAFFFEEFNLWQQHYELSKNSDECLLTEDFFDALIGGYDKEDFYITHYHQAIHWQRCNISQSRVMLILSQCRQLFILLSEKIDNAALAKALCHAVDLGQSIAASVYQIHHVMQNMQQKTEADISRMRRSFTLIAAAVPEDLIQAYIDHQQWKIRTYSAALGEIEYGNFTASVHECCLGKWLDAGGLDKIPEDERESFQAAHEQVHQLGHSALVEVKKHRPERIVGFLTEMEIASDEVSRVLLERIEDEFVRLATLDPLTNLPNRRAFDLQLSHNLAFSTRHKFWIGLIVVDIDHFKVINDEFGHAYGDEVLIEVSRILESTLRLEDRIYRWGGEEFVVLSLDKASEGTLVLAERIRVAVEANLFCADSQRPTQITVSCGAICFQNDVELAEHEVFSMADKELYHAKNAGRNRVSHSVIEAD